MGELTDWSIEEQMFPDFNLIYNLDFTKREKKRLQKFREKFIWTDKEGVKHKLKEIDDTYLQNIINFLKRKVEEIPPFEDEYMGDDSWSPSSNEGLIYQYERTIDFLEWEQKQRRLK